MNIENEIDKLLELWNAGYRDSYICIETERKLEQLGYDIERYFRDWRNRNERELVIIRDCERGDCNLAYNDDGKCTGHKFD